MASREDQEYSSQAPAPYIGQFLQGDVFPFAQQFLRQQFRDYGQADSSPYTYTGQRVADFDPREQYGMQLADSAIGSYRPYLGRQAGLLDEASSSVRAGQDLGRGFLDRAESTGYESTRGFDPSGIGSFYNPFEDQVVDQTLEDINRGFAKADMGLRDRAVSQGAFGGSRGRIAQEELARQAKAYAEALAATPPPQITQPTGGGNGGGQPQTGGGGYERGDYGGRGYHWAKGGRVDKALGGSSRDIG